MKEIYSWVPWFAELCAGIANNGPDFLAERARRIPWKEGGEEPALLRQGDENIDPFSFVYSLAAYNYNVARRRVYPRVGEEFELSSELPVELDDAFIFPTPPGVTALFPTQGSGDLALLWRLFRSAVEGMDAVSGEDFEAAQGLTGVAAAKLTQALFLVNGREFLPYDGATQSLRDEASRREHRIAWDDYRHATIALGDAFPGCQPFEINLLAYETSKSEDALKPNPASLWQISTRVYGHDHPVDMWEDFERGNWAYTGGPGTGSWDEYDQVTTELTYEVAAPQRGDVLLVRHGRVGHGIGVVYRNDYAQALTSDARLHLLWLSKRDRDLPGNWGQLKAFTRAHRIGTAFRDAYPQAFAYLDRVAAQPVDGEARGAAAREGGVSPPDPLNTILFGPPGTGKTWRTVARSVEICDGAAPEGEELRVRYEELVAAGRIEFVTFHQSFGYEEFVEGIRPVVEDGEVAYRVQDGVLKRLAAAARTRQRAEPFVLVIDEINRANISKVMGELITVLEEDKRQDAENEVEVTLPYSRERFTLPANLHILGTMNTADRSIALLDTALRRRFEFEEMAPDSSVLGEAAEHTGVDLPRVLTAINERLEYLVDRDHLLGHAWLMRARNRGELDTIMRRKVIPLIAEYFYDDWNKVQSVLGGTDDFVGRHDLPEPPGLDPDMVEGRYRWVVRQEFGEEAYEALLRGGRILPAAE
ncbi:MAG: AAA domain-containing protein [Gammaproteobacteria bacterium]|nr:AAA domain-containing protein [Gammaproteobacteria bacterium]MYF30357.1 AAA domain-containing protein [Gammaproteobacteria bacterium]MYK46733.1 AAA domain-containing protein [Gammaproteobacteria bacterium]